MQKNFVFYRNFRPPEKKYENYYIDGSIFQKPKYLIYDKPSVKIDFLEKELIILSNYLGKEIKKITNLDESYDMLLPFGEKSAFTANAKNLIHESPLEYTGSLHSFTSFFSSITYKPIIFNPQTSTQQIFLNTLKDFLETKLANYEEARSKIKHLTSGLSKYNAIGAISIVELLTFLEKYKDTEYYRQVCWIAYCKLKVSKFPSLSEPILTNKTLFLEWATGILPEKSVVEKYLNREMNNLLAGKTVSNRFRLMSVHYLVSELNIDWRYGEAHFYYYLIDGHELINYYNWYWQVYRNRFRMNYNLERQCKLHGD